MRADRHLLMTADAVGGVWTYAMDLAAALVPLGTRTTLAVMGTGVEARHREAAAAIPRLTLVETGWPLDWLAKEPSAILRAGEALAALASRVRADLLQLNSPALAAAARFPCPVVGVCHSCLATWWDAMRQGALPDDFAWRDALLKQGYARCDALVAPSRAFAAATARVHGLALPEVVWNGRRASGVAARAGHFAFTAGRLWDEAKDVATLDAAAAVLDLPFFAAGPTGAPHGSVVALPHLRLLGGLDAQAIAAWLARGPIFVSAARYEPFGLAVLEAAQAGCALVLSDIPTFRELWDGAAVFVRPGDAAAFADAIFMLSRNREQRSLLRVAALHRSQRYTAEAMAAGMAAIHARLLAQGGGRSAA
ncbi:glycosyltransferase family 4 protein [Falsiroseomonas sp. HW251]|uniref:glycosyltransferase family 4 protein n=1 Tax=Falsiroseomonas sp. HW251 TaxID=3390998 RepID=UPI003D319C64